jgi:hypothetical protein
MWNGSPEEHRTAGPQHNRPTSIGCDRSLSSSSCSTLVNMVMKGFSFNERYGSLTAKSLHCPAPIVEMTSHSSFDDINPFPDAGKILILPSLYTSDAFSDVYRVRVFRIRVDGTENRIPLSHSSQPNLTSLSSADFVIFALPGLEAEVLTFAILSNTFIGIDSGASPTEIMARPWVSSGLNCFVKYVEIPDRCENCKDVKKYSNNEEFN